jgi:hypothetical protein
MSKHYKQLNSNAKLLEECHLRRIPVPKGIGSKKFELVQLLIAHDVEQRQKSTPQTVYNQQNDSDGSLEIAQIKANKALAMGELLGLELEKAHWTSRLSKPQELLDKALADINRKVEEQQTKLQLRLENWPLLGIEITAATAGKAP